MDSCSLSLGTREVWVPAQGSVIGAVYKGQGHSSHTCSHTQEKQLAETHSEGNRSIWTWHRPGNLAPLAVYIPMQTLQCWEGTTWQQRLQMCQLDLFLTSSADR